MTTLAPDGAEQSWTGVPIPPASLRPLKWFCNAYDILPVDRPRPDGYVLGIFLARGGGSWNGVPTTHTSRWWMSRELAEQALAQRPDGFLLLEPEEVERLSWTIIRDPQGSYRIHAPVLLAA